MILKTVTDWLIVIVCTVILFAGTARAQYCDFLPGIPFL